MRVSVQIAALVGASLLLGLLRDVFIARKFGATFTADILFVSLILPVLFENVLGIALRDSVIPRLRSLADNHPARFGVVVRRLYANTAVLALATTLVVAAGSPWLLRVLVPGWSEQQRLEAYLPFCVGVSLIAVQTVLYFQSGVLNSRLSFILPNWRPVLQNVAAVVVLATAFASPTSVLFALLGVQLLLLVAFHNRISPFLVRVPNDGVTEPLALASSATALMSVAGLQQVAVMAERLFASSMSAGTITALSLAFRLTTIPLTLYAFSVFAVAYPKLSRSFFLPSAERSRLFLWAQSLALVILVPAAVLLATIGEGAVALVLAGGSWSAADLERLGVLLRAYAIGLPALGLALLWGRVMTAHNSFLPLVGSAIAGLSVTLALDVVLRGPLGAAGLALAFSAGATVQGALCGYHLSSKAPGTVDVASLARWYVAAAAVSWLGRGWNPESVDLVVAYGIATVVVLFAALWILGERHLFTVRFWQTSGRP